MIFSQYKETCEVIMYYPKIWEEGIKYYIKKEIRNLPHTNIDVQSRRLIAELPGDGVKCISKLQAHRANMNFSDKIRYDLLSHKVKHKGGESQMNYIKRFQNAPAKSVSVGKIILRINECIFSWITFTTVEKIFHI